MTSTGGIMTNMSSPETEVKTLQEVKKDVAEFYDELVWEDVWGEHIHLGFYEPTQSSVSLDSAQTRMIEEALRFASISEDPVKKPKSIEDVGCGSGGSSRYLAKKYGATVRGITLSPVQVERAQALAAAQGLADKVSFQVADAMNQPFPDGQFDLVWSVESADYMPDKEKFISELARVTAPGGTIIIVTFCHRELSPSEEFLLPDEKELLNKIIETLHLRWCSSADYVRLLQSNSLQEIKAADWSENIAPFWPAFTKSLLTWKGLKTIIRTGWKTIKLVRAIQPVIEGYNKGLIRYCIITCRKPEYYTRLNFLISDSHMQIERFAVVLNTLMNNGGK